MNTDALNISNVTSSAGVRCTRDTRITHVLFPVLYTLLFLVGVTLNALSMWVFVHIPNTSIFIVYLKSTLVADFVMSLMLPFKIITDSGLGPWQLKAFVCRYSAVIFYETMYISIILLCLIALDRFMKIVQPCGKVCMENVTFAKILSGIVWLCMFALALPNTIFSNMEVTPTTVAKCSSLKSQFGLKWHAAVNYICLIIFWTVFVLMILFYTVIAKKVYESYKSSRSKATNTHKRMKAKVFVVVAVFFVCFAPFHFVRVPYTQSQTGGVSDCNMQNRLFIAKEATLWLAATNICMDPLIYIFLCKPFREKLSCFAVRRKKTSSLDTAATQLNNETTL